MANSVDPDETARLIWIYTICSGIGFGLPGLTNVKFDKLLFKLHTAKILYEGPAKSFVTGFGLLRCYVLSNIFYYKPSKYSNFTETHFCNLFTQSQKADK